MKVYLGICAFLELTDSVLRKILEQTCVFDEIPFSVMLLM